MSDSVSEYEKLASSYLGKEYDIDKREVTDDLLLYDSKDLVTHGVIQLPCYWFGCVVIAGKEEPAATVELIVNQEVFEG